MSQVLQWRFRGRKGSEKGFQEGAFEKKLWKAETSLFGEHHPLQGNPAKTFMFSWAQSQVGNEKKYPLRRNDYQNNSINIFSCNCPGAITGFSCRAPENNSPKIVSCMGPCPVRPPPCNSPWGSYRIFL